MGANTLGEEQFNFIHRQGVAHLRIRFPVVFEVCLRLETACIENQFCCKALAVIVSIQSKISFRREPLFAFSLTSQVGRKELPQNIQDQKELKAFSILINRQKCAEGINMGEWE